MNDERLISVVFEHPSIYDQNHFLFEDEGFKKYLWEVIASDMGNTTAEECENRFELLREKYTSGILILCKNAFSDSTWSQIEIIFSDDSQVLERERRPVVHCCYECMMSRCYAPITDRRMTDTGYAPVTDNFYEPLSDSSYEPIPDNPYEPMTFTSYEPMIQSSYVPITGNSYEPLTDSSYEPIPNNPYEPMTFTSYELMTDSGYELPSTSGAIY